jgi:hypothetical protein
VVLCYAVTTDQGIVENALKSQQKSAKTLDVPDFDCSARRRGYDGQNIDWEQNSDKEQPLSGGLITSFCQSNARLAPDERRRSSRGR